MNPKNLIRMIVVAGALLLAGAVSSAGEVSMLQRTYTVKMNERGATVRSFTNAFTEQTGVVFSYESSLAGKRLGAVSLQAKDASLEDLLSEAFRGKGISYEVVGSTVVLTAAEPQQPTPAAAPQDRARKTVKGQVVDNAGEPLAAAGVMVKGTNRGTMTDTNGNWSMETREGETLVFSFIGFTDEEVVVGRSSVINVALSIDQNILDDVVVIGYGTQSRKTLTTAVAKVDGKSIESAPVSTVADALKGKVTGLHIVSNNNLPGEAPSMLIRGGSSINRSNAPLTLVDGVERGFEDLSPNDIESISVLKDAASTAVYGSRASNGVILVTTKKGDAFKAPQVVFEAQVGVTTPAKKWNMANSTQFLNMVRPAAYYGPNSTLVLDGANGPGVGNTTSTATYSTRYLADGESVPDGYLSMPDPINPTKTIIYTNHDWQSDWYDTAGYYKQYVGINGGNKAMKYAASISHLTDEGMVAMSRYENFTMHGNTSFKITNKLTASTTFDFSRNLKNPMTSDYFAALGRGLMMSPTHIGKYEDGTFATGGTNKNQQSAEFYSTFYDRENSRQKFMGNMNLKWDITPWLSATAQYAMFDNYYRGSYYAYGERNGSINFVSTTRSTSESRTETNRQNFQAYLTLNKQIGKGKLDGTAGYDWSYWTYYSLSTSNTGALDDKIPYLQSGGDNTSGTMSMSNAEYSTAMISYFGRLAYNYLDRYILAGTIRADGSSLFLEENRWGYFPSVSGAWVISEEPFFAPLRNEMNHLKLRVSYGQTGNNNIARTAPLGAYATGSYAGYNTLLPSVMQNAGLRWETTTQLDAGIDAGFKNDRIRVVLDYYDKVTSDLIYSITLPDTGQFGSVTSNVGSVRFYGFEAELHTVNIRNRNFEWSTDITYSFNRNKVLSLPEDYAYEIIDMDGNPTGEIGYRIGGTSTANGYRYGGTAVGEPLGRIWGYKVAGILQTDEEAAAALYDTQSHGYRRSDGMSITGRKDAGDFEWLNRYGTAKTADGLEQIDATDLFLLGNVVPHSIGGINNSFTWKRLTINVYMDFALGHSIYNYMKTRMVQNTLGYSNSNFDVDLAASCWRYPGDKTDVARFFPNDADYGNRNFSRCSSFNVEDASYLCLRDVSVYYDLPDKWAAKAGMKRITVGVTGNTLHYFTRVSGAISPETGIAADADGTGLYSSVQMGSSNSNIMPPAAKLLANLKITF